MNRNFFLKYGDDGLQHEYIYFGMYPQNVVDDIKIIEKLNEIEVEENEIFTYNEKQYIKVISSLVLAALSKKDVALFHNGKKIENYEKYYFEVSPLLWRVIKRNNDTALLISEYIIDSIFPINMRYDLEAAQRGKALAEQNFRDVRIYNQAIAMILQKEYNFFLNTIGDVFLSKAFLENEINEILLPNDEIMCYRSIPKEKQKLLSRAYLTDYSKVRHCICGVGKKKDLSQWWMVKDKKDKNDDNDSLNVSNPFFCFSPNNSSYIGIRPVIELIISDDMYDKNLEIINDNIKKRLKEEIIAQEKLESLKLPANYLSIEYNINTSVKNTMKLYFRDDLLIEFINNDELISIPLNKIEAMKCKLHNEHSIYLRGVETFVYTYGDLKLYYDEKVIKIHNVEYVEGILCLLYFLKNNYNNCKDNLKEFTNRDAVSLIYLVRILTVKQEKNMIDQIERFIKYKITPSYFDN